MKTLKYFLFICFAAQFINAQSSIVIGTGASIDVALGADICADVITGTLTGDGTKCGAAIPKILNLTALIEGFYNGTTMVSDTVRVQFRNTAAPYSLVEEKKFVLSTAGAGTASLTSVLNGTSYYLVVRHRNSLETWSGAGKTFTSNVLNYDFTTAATQAYGSNMKLKGTKWCIINGDCNQDDFIDGSDYLAIVNNWEAEDPGMAGDTNGDQYIDGSDYLQIVNNWEVGAVTPLTLKKVSKPITVDVKSLE